jgi:two-component system, sensor histidine kinase PhcS
MKIMDSTAAASFHMVTDKKEVRGWNSMIQRFPWLKFSGTYLGSEALEERFEDENCAQTLRNAKIGAWIVLILVPLCSIMDYLIYPDEFWRFTALRIACSICCLPLLFGIDRSIGRKHYRAFPILLPVIPAIFISTMIYLTGDPASEYYAGLILCIVGTSFVFNWTFREIALTLTIILSVYLIATLPNLSLSDSPTQWGLFMNNTVFILLNCVILLASSFHHHNIRTSEFLTRCTAEDQREELRSRNEELTLALQRLRETEAQLFQSEKIASLDRLSAGIIHEINNPLNFAKSALFVLNKKSRKLPEGDREVLTRIINDVGEGIDRVASIVSDLRSFSHPDHTRSNIDLGKCIAKGVRMIRQELEDRRIGLDATIPGGLTAVGHENHLIQILINLVQNSMAALKDQADPMIDITARQIGQRIEIAVRDNGTGIESDILPRIFDPFFTTKEVGEGMGMGLNICYRMIKQMGGGIEVESEVGNFTRFTIWLPVEFSATHEIAA